MDGASPAGNLESLVINRIRALLADQGAILDAVRREHPDGTDQKRLISRGRQIAEELQTMTPAQTRAMLMALVSQVDLKSDRVEIKMRRRSLVQLLHEQPTAPNTRGRKSDTESEDILTLKVKARLQRVGREMRMLVENAHDQTLADPGLLRVVARAHDIQLRLMQSTARSVLLLVTSPGFCVFRCWLRTLSPPSLTARTPRNSPPKS